MQRPTLLYLGKIYFQIILYLISRQNMLYNKRPGLYFIITIAVAIATACNTKTNPDSRVSLNEVTGNETDTSNTISGIFDITELPVAPSPAQSQSIPVPPGETVTGYDVSPQSPSCAVLMQGKNGLGFIRFWQIGRNAFTDSCPLPAAFTATEIKWHPRASALFVLGNNDKKFEVLRVEKTKQGWTTKSIFSATTKLKNMVVCPRPFITMYETGKQFYNYRLFMGEEYKPGIFKIVSVTERGAKLYSVTNPDAVKKPVENAGDDEGPNELKASWAVPVAFHPAGHELIWKDANGKLNVARYAGDNWGNTSAITQNIPTGYVQPTINGLGLLCWQKNQPGLGLYTINSGNYGQLIKEITFTQQPLTLADGKGVVGLTGTGAGAVLHYIPLQIPLADVTNAWMYISHPDEMSLFTNNNGLFRAGNNVQLYNLYETENYYCSGYSRNIPTRPYMVTTDIFWELYSAAYEGIFVISERDVAVPSFQKFISAANEYYKKTNHASKWAPVFNTLSDLINMNDNDPEVQKIIAASAQSYSQVIKGDFNYAALKPRGHYVSDTGMQRYFMAFKYFTLVYADSNEVLKELNMLPAETKKYAAQWIESYTGFIAGSRKNMVWSDLQNNRPAYNQIPGSGLTIIPLSWGFDNEVLFNTVYQTSVKPDMQVTGRFTPSGLDLAAALGSNFAVQLLQTDYQQYPPLHKVIDALRQNFDAHGHAGKNSGLYDQWLYALATQWADTTAAPNGAANTDLWHVKRLQTGLASWATLRHATGLVNETTAAECGESGFEEILLRAPRGYVEPDPQTLEAIASLFEATARYVPHNELVNKDSFSLMGEDNEALYEGITKRLTEVAGDARLFKAMAIKEKNGEALTNDEYEKIMFIGRVAEHDFLIFKSLLNASHSLVLPDPMAKIAEVAGNGTSVPYLMVAAGNPLEWDNLVPFFGRHEIVKGPVYSYYEFKSENLLNDKEWAEKVKSQSILPWVKPYFTPSNVSYPAVTGY